MSFKDSPFIRKLLLDGSWVLFGRISSIFASFVGVRLLTEFILPETFGVYSLVLGIALFTIGLLSSSLLAGGQRIYADQITPANKRQARREIQKLLQKGQIAVVSLFILGGAIYNWFYPKIGIWIFLIFSVCVVISTERTLEINLLLIARRQKAVAIWQSVEQWLRPVFIIGCVVFLAQTPTMIALGYTLSIAFTLWLFHSLPLQLEGIADSPPETEPPTKDAENPDATHPSAIGEQIKKSIVTYTLPLIPLSIVGQIHSVGDRYLIGGMLGSKEVGIYVATYGLISQALSSIGSVTAMTLYPNFVNAIRDKNESRRKRLAWMWPCAVLLMSSVAAIAIYLLQDFVFALALAKRYHGGKELLAWLLAGLVFLNVSSSEGLQMYAYSKTNNALANEFVCAITSIAISIPMIYWKGLRGAAIACAIYYFLYMLIGFFFMKRSEHQWLTEQRLAKDQNSTSEPTPT